VLSGKQKKQKGEVYQGPIIATRETAIYQEFMEELPDMSKTSQQNKKVAKAVAGQAKAKAEKKAKAPKTPRAPKEAFEGASLPGATGIVSKQCGEKFLTHTATNGKTACGVVTEMTKDMTVHRVTWVKTPNRDVTCGRCLKALNKTEKAPKEKKAKADKKPTPISKGKAKKAKKAAKVTSLFE